MKFVFTIISALFFFGCNNSDKETLCDTRPILATFIGFKLSEINTLLYISYNANSSFLSPVDTFKISNQVVNGGYGIYTTTNDTTIVSVEGPYPAIGVYPGPDWKIVIPFLSRSVSVSNIVSLVNSGPKNCTSPINSFVQDGNLINAPTYFQTSNFSTTGYRVYIKR